MGYRVPAPYGIKDKDNLPVLILPDDTLLHDSYRVKFMALGGMSIVYEGFKGLDRFIIKEVDGSDSRRVISLTQEKSTLERLDHEGIVKVFDFFERDGFYYLVMEFIVGESLDKLVSPIPGIFIQEKVVFDWAIQLYNIFEYLHGLNPPVIYRDLKPQNIIKDKEGKIHLVDFGIARVFKANRISDTEPLGSALTASPEHYGGKQTDIRSDIFTLGATLHYILTNGKTNRLELFKFPPVREMNPKVSKALEMVIQKSLQLNPDDRFQTIAEMREAHIRTREIAMPSTDPSVREASTTKLLIKNPVKETEQKEVIISEPETRIKESKSSIFGMLAIIFLIIAATWLIVTNILIPDSPYNLKHILNKIAIKSTETAGLAVLPTPHSTMSLSVSPQASISVSAGPSMVISSGFPWKSPEETIKASLAPLPPALKTAEPAAAAFPISSSLFDKIKLKLDPVCHKDFKGKEPLIKKQAKIAFLSSMLKQPPGSVTLLGDKGINEKNEFVDPEGRFNVTVPEGYFRIGYLPEKNLGYVNLFRFAKTDDASHKTLRFLDIALITNFNPKEDIEKKYANYLEKTGAVNIISEKIKIESRHCLKFSFNKTAGKNKTPSKEASIQLIFTDNINKKAYLISASPPEEKSRKFSSESDIFFKTFRLN